MGILVAAEHAADDGLISPRSGVSHWERFEKYEIGTGRYNRYRFTRSQKKAARIRAALVEVEGNCAGPRGATFILRGFEVYFWPVHSSAGARSGANVFVVESAACPT